MVIGVRLELESWKRGTVTGSVVKRKRQSLPEEAGMKVGTEYLNLLEANN